MANYTTILSGEHWFKVKDPEKFRELCQEILSQVGGYDVSVVENSAAIYGEGSNFSLAGALEDPELFEEDDGSNPIQELRDLIEEYALDPCVIEEVGWERCRYVTYDKYEIIRTKPTKETLAKETLAKETSDELGYKMVEKTFVFVIILVEKGLISDTWTVEGTESLAIKTAEDLAVKLKLNPENHDLAIEELFLDQPDYKINRNKRIWTWWSED